MDKQTRKTKRIKRTRLRLKQRLLRPGRCLPRLSVFRSNKYIYGQIIDDVKGETLVAASDRETEKQRNRETETKQQKAYESGKVLGERAFKKGIKKVVFDRGPYKFHGRIKAFAEGARSAGLEF